MSADYSLEQQGSSQGQHRRKREKACAACAIQHVRCERREDNNACLRCIKMALNCVYRTSRKADVSSGQTTGEAGQLSQPVSAADHVSTLPTTVAAPPHSTFAAFMDSSLMTKLIATSSKLKLIILPLVHQLDLQQEYTAAGSLLNMDPTSQALLMSVAALSARYVTPQAFDYLDAPTLSQLSKTPHIRQGVELCAYGKRRERPAQVAHEIAIKVLNESCVFAEPSIRSIAALTTMEMLIQAYRVPNQCPRLWYLRAGFLSGAAAGQLRSLAEVSWQSGGSECAQFCGTAWLCIFRDFLVASFTGRSLHYTSDDLRIILKVNEDAYIPIPSAEDLLEAWMNPSQQSPFAVGSPARHLFSVVLQRSRAFVNRVTSPLASVEAELHIAVIENLFACFGRIRLVLNETHALARNTIGQHDIPDFANILWYSTDFCLLQAHRMLLQNTARANERSGTLDRNNESQEGRGDLSTLPALRQKSEEEVFQASQRVALRFSRILMATTEHADDCFPPGYFLFEDIPSWVDVITQSKCNGELGGRANYPLSKKLADLRVFREVLAILGWSYGDIQPQIESINEKILYLEQWEACANLAVFETLTRPHPFPL